MAGAEVVRELIAKLGVEFNKAQFAAADKAIEKVRWQMEKLVWSGSKGKFLLPEKTLAGVTAGMAKVNAATVSAGASLKDMKHKLESLAAGTEFGVMGDKLQKAWEGVKLFSKGPAGAAAGAAAGVAALGLALGYAADETAKKAVEMQRAASRANMDVIGFQEIVHGAEATGTGIDTVNMALGRLGRTMGEAKNGNKGATKAFDKLGVTFKDAAGKMRPANDVLMNIADKFKDMPEGVERGNLAIKLFGRGGLETVDWLSRGSAQLKKFAEGAHEAGVIHSKETIKMAKAYGLAKHEISEAFEGFFFRIGTKMLPYLLKIAQGFEHWVAAMRPVFQSGIDLFLQNSIALFKTLGLAMWPIKMAFDALSGIMKMNVTTSSPFLQGLVAGFKAVLTPVLTLWKAIEDLYYYWSGKGSRLGLSIAIARGKGKEYAAGRKAGKTFDLQGNVVEPGAPPGPPGAAGQFVDTAKKKGGETVAGQAFRRGLAEDQAGNWGKALLNYAGALGSLPTLLPDAIIRGYAQLADQIRGPSEGAAAGFATPEWDWRNPQNGPQVSREPRLPGFAPAGEWEKPLPLDVNVHVTADEGLKVQADQHLKKELRKAGR